MVGLGDFILYYNIQKDDPMYQHLCIEFDNYSLLTESKGVPSGLRDDSTFIVNQIEKQLKTNNKDFETNIPLSKLKMNIFDSLKISVVFDDVSYNSHEGFTNFKNDYDANFIITIFINNKPDIGKLRVRIGHELLHCYDYVKSGKDYLTTNDHDIKSFFLRRLNKISYNDLFDKSGNFEDRFIKQFLYYTNEDEVNAFIAEITLEIEQNKPKDQDDSYKLLRKNTMYNLYMDMDSILKGSFFDKDEKHIICNIYRVLVTPDENYSDKQVWYKLTNRIKRIKKRLINIIPRICYENRNDSITMISTRRFINEFNKHIYGIKYDKI